ncbi:MAG TPA: hypothetical protein VF581_01160 [Flavobacterium sp.]
MRPKLILLFLTVALVTGCGCNDEGSETFELNPFERSVIPFSTEIVVEYLDENNQTVNATISRETTEFINLNSSDDESCFVSLSERNECTYKFANSDKIYYVAIQKRNNYADFNIYSSDQQYFIVQDLDAENIEAGLIDLSIGGFSFTQVFHFISPDPESEIESIIYSAQNGIEFIKYRSGSFLKLN